MEFLLINHPLDCPICDQGGECDLQDQAVAYGRGASRYDENKRAVTEKYMGPLIKTVMTRCIHCTRCVRFSEEVAGVDEIGALYRGEDMQITTYLEQAAKHELCANVIDLCPVGALTIAALRLRGAAVGAEEDARASTCPTRSARTSASTAAGAKCCACCRASTTTSTRSGCRDKARYMVDGLTRRRLDQAWIRRGGKLEAASWDEAFEAIAKAKPGASIAAIAGDMVDCETMFAAKKLLDALGSTLLEGRQTGMDYPTGNLAAVNFNSTLRRDRERRCDPDRRQPRPLGSAAGQRAAAQGGQARGEGVRRRPALGDDLRGRVPRRRCRRCCTTCRAMSPKRSPRPSGRR